MESTISSVALAVHDLGLAAGFGGALFGKMALNPAVKAVDSESERREVLRAAWGGFNWVNGASMAAVGLTWIVGRTALSGREANSRGLTLTKDILTGAMVVSGMAAYIGGRKLAAHTDATSTKQHNSSAGLGSDGAGNGSSSNGMSGESGDEADYARTRAFVGTAGTVNLIAAAGVIAVTAMLNIQAGRSVKWAFLSRLLP